MGVAGGGRATRARLGGGRRRRAAKHALLQVGELAGDDLAALLLVVELARDARQLGVGGASVGAQLLAERVARGFRPGVIAVAGGWAFCGCDHRLENGGVSGGGGVG